MAFMGINFHKNWIFGVVLGCLHRDNYLGCALRALGLLLADGAQWGGGRFFARQMVPLTKTDVTQKRNAKKSVRCQNDRNAEGYKCPFDNSRGPIAKNGILGQN